MLNTRLKKIIFFSIITVVLVAGIVITTVALNNYKFSQSYADRINNAYNSGDPFTYNELMKKYGTPYSKEITGTPSDASGYVEWYKGYEEGDDKEIVKDYRAGKDIKSMYVEFLNGEAVLAEFYCMNINTDEPVDDPTLK